jgi:hypothetical protein
MSRCSRCGIVADGQYCSACGTKLSSLSPTQAAYSAPVPAAGPGYSMPHAAAARGFGQIFGLDPRIAALTLVVDFMLFGGEFVTAGLIWPFSVAAGLVLGLIAYKAQMRWYGDDRESALIKGLILGLLTAIPTPIPAFLYIPSGIVGLVHNFRRK